MMMSSGSDLLSARASVIWIAALFAVLIFHCSHLFHMGGERRWYHSAHVVMLLGMLYMYAAVAFGVDWLPTSVWMIIYVATSAAIIGWMLVRYMRRHSFGYLWILALAQQGAMIYMWMPMRYWVPRLSYALVVYFALETIAWLMRAYIRPRAGNALAGVGGSVVIPLAHRSVFGDVCMTIMAASMAYMFAGMQLIMSMPPQSQLLAKRQQPAPSQGVSDSRHSGSGVESPAKPPIVVTSKLARPLSETLPSTPAPLAPEERYTIAAGDSLRGIAARLYGDARQWRSIMKANPGLDPRRLRIGQVIRLPMALSPR